MRRNPFVSRKLIGLLGILQKAHHGSAETAPSGVTFNPGNFALEKGDSLRYRISTRAVNSAGECYLHTVEVTGSNPVPPTMNDQGVAVLRRDPFFFVYRQVCRRCYSNSSSMDILFRAEGDCRLMAGSLTILKRHGCALQPEGAILADSSNPDAFIGNGVGPEFPNAAPLFHGLFRRQHGHPLRSHPCRLIG
jgi:hypothetical protein